MQIMQQVDVLDFYAQEQEDIEHRDRCEGKQNANKNSKEERLPTIKCGRA